MGRFYFVEFGAQICNSPGRHTIVELAQRRGADALTVLPPPPPVTAHGTRPGT
jgi:hypothetical protein